MKTHLSKLVGINRPRNTKAKARFLRLQNLSFHNRLPIGANTTRAIVLNLSTTFPACAWAFVKMI